MEPRRTPERPHHGEGRGRSPRGGFGLLPSPLGGEGQDKESPTALGMAPPYRTRGSCPRQSFAALRAGASDFGNTRPLWQITPKVFSPACSPSCVGIPRRPRLSNGTRRWALTFTIHGIGQRPLPTSLSLRQTGSSIARLIPVLPMPQRRSLGIASRPRQTGSPRRTTGSNTQPSTPRARARARARQGKARQGKARQGQLILC